MQTTEGLMSKYSGRAMGLATLALMLTAASGPGGISAGSGAGAKGQPVDRAPVSGGVLVSSTQRVEVDAVRADARAVAGRRPAPRAARGYAYLASSIVAQTPGGFDAWVDPHAAHHWLIAKNTAASVKTLRSLGTRIRYRGYGSPAAAEGIVRVREGKKGCGDGGGTVGLTWTYWSALPSGKNYVTRADVYLCPSLFRMGTWAVRATVGHELGHAMGLGHVAYVYRGSYQLMNPVVRPGVANYRSGDRQGLRRLAGATRKIAAQVPPTGHLDGSNYQDDGSIQFKGWAVLRYAKTSPVTVVLLDNGKVIDSGGASTTSQHGFVLSVPWNGGRHTYCVDARSAAHPKASARLGCVTWHD
jgi:hypothetical protein